MQKPDVVFWFLLPTDQNPTEPIHPTMGAFHHPTSGSDTRFPFEVSGFFTPRADMRRKAKSGQDIADFLIIITLVQTEPLRMLGGRLGTCSHQMLKRLTHHFHIMPICPIDRQPYRDPMPFGHHTALDPAFAPV